ncbi:hypothetical protein GE253_11515 [Niveispirillum sp. SYP-B3756]|uniref:hypothetical protein n=1 Tax=Niveispirillum sp. SYP-B3756 TaxID=2662178 RepID=UPI001291D012|nr:hypothetical protein [Niveispirillum sp. SYP-B3756]MQP65967.1 hypothetical protein [Niveispirillum sp. SYP-B3756]
MSLMQPLFHYRVCGLSVASDFALPGMVTATESVSQPDVCVRRGTTPAKLDTARRIGPTWQLNDTAFLFQVPQVARFLVTDGSEVVVDVDELSTTVDAAPFLLGTAFGVLLHQRGQLVLHAATVSYRGRGVALCGITGAGKSTLAAALCRAGCDFVGDDVAAIRFDVGGVPTILPDGRQHRLWMDAAEQLALTDRIGPPVRPSMNKFHVDPPRVPTQDPMPLSAIFILRTAATSRLLELEPVDAAALLRDEVYRSKPASHLGRDADLFRQIAVLIGQVQVFLFERSMDFTQLDDTVAAVLAKFGTKA